jgi:WD40 repeat protein
MAGPIASTGRRYRAPLMIALLMGVVGSVGPPSALAAGGDWTYTADLGDGQIDFATDVAFSADGTRVFAAVAGGVVAVALDAITGELQWQATDAGVSIGFPSWVFVHPGGDVVIVVGSTGSGLLLARYDAMTGTELSAHVLGDAEMQIWPSDAALSPDGESLYVAGSTVAVGADPDFATLALSVSTGEIQWTHHMSGDGPARDVANDVSVSADGSAVAVTGVLSGGATGGGRDAMTVIYETATGDERWRRRYDHAPLGTNGDQGTQVGVVGDGARRVYVAVASDYGWTTLSYRGSDGRRLWSARYETRWGAAPVSLAVGPNGTNLYLTGTSYASTSAWATRAYRATDGALVWSHRRPSVGGPEELVVGPGGARVYVAGGEEGTATVGYRAKDGRLVWARTIQDTVQLIALALSPDGARIAEGGMDYDLDVADTVVWGFDTGT